jgi:hypothetical protein
MSRSAVGDTVVVKPANNIYTVLSGVALVVVLLGLVVLFLRGQTLFNGGLFGPPTSTTTVRR